MSFFWIFSALFLLFETAPITLALSLQRVNRRDALCSSAAAAGASVALICMPALAAEGLASKLTKRDPALLKNSVFNVPPSAQVYPDFLKGTWKVTSRFNGYLFPSARIPKSRLTRDFEIPGFQKCSIAAVCDVGKELTEYQMKIDDNGMEDRPFTLQHEIDAFLGYPAVARVIYDASRNPNRISIDFVEYKTRNAERIELFCNARESELYKDESGDKVFVCSEYIRQVTFGGSETVGVARQVVGNYAHFWTWRKSDAVENKLIGNLLTAAYLNPQDPLFFDEPSKPVAIYSHVLTADYLQC